MKPTAVKLILTLLLIGLCSLRSAHAADEPVKKENAKKVKALFVTQSKGFVHGSVKRPADNGGRTLAPAEIAMTQLGQTTGLFDLHCTQECEHDFTEANLKNYDIVMFYTTGDLPIPEADRDYFFKTWTRQKGHGVVGFHSATDTFHNYEPYWDMIGGTFNGHPWGSNNTVTISVHDRKHPASHPFGSVFQIKDEIYQYKHWQPEKVRVLMSLNMEKCNPKQPYQVPVAWVKEMGDGRLFYTNLGHNAETWTNPTFLKSVEGGIRWILQLESGDATPNPKVSAAEEVKAKAAAAKEPAKDAKEPVKKTKTKKSKK